MAQGIVKTGEAHKEAAKPRGTFCRTLQFAVARTLARSRVVWSINKGVALRSFRQDGLWQSGTPTSFRGVQHGGLWSFGECASSALSNSFSLQIWQQPSPQLSSPRMSAPGLRLWMHLRPTRWACTRCMSTYLHHAGFSFVLRGLVGAFVFVNVRPELWPASPRNHTPAPLCGPNHHGHGHKKLSGVTFSVI
ncbi:hypothetical protein BS50DRAFT_84627 [Corynespora cassiicola Philippines]|uniref:Uncharacterized protein n=1 Tax=Corynespora cassiicola Philippines TaxID=1448308 RepID=A0A2T2NDS8_CORCC|nr:hypothetical protein BS50DRAFT_84627 [Corynespora cassiicola Philippines]